MSTGRHPLAVKLIGPAVGIPCTAGEHPLRLVRTECLKQTWEGLRQGMVFCGESLPLWRELPFCRRCSGQPGIRWACLAFFVCPGLYCWMQ